jgi:hypothetical protein
LPRECRVVDFAVSGHFRPLCSPFFSAASRLLERLPHVTLRVCAPRHRQNTCYKSGQVEPRSSLRRPREPTRVLAAALRRLAARRPIRLQTASPSSRVPMDYLG